MSIIDLATAKLHLRVDDTAEDATIQIYLDAAEAASSNYLNRTLYATEGDKGSDADGLVMNPAVKAAILLHCGTLYATRESVSQMPGNYMIAVPLGYQWMLDPYRLEMGV